MRLALILLIMFAAGCVGTGGNVVAKNGDMVLVDYIGKLEDGTLFDTSVESVARESGTYNSGREYAPLEVELGSGSVVRGFNDAILGMKVGATKTATLEPKDAYGEPDQELIISVPISDLKKAGIKPDVGMTVGTASGTRGTITAVGAQNATVDFNHPLAGKTLVFEIMLVGIM